MEKYLAKIESEIKKLISFKKVNPHNHWKNLLYVFFVIIVALIVFSFYLLYKTRGQQEFQIIPEPTKAPSFVNDKLLDKVSESFNQKFLKEKETIDNPKTYKDPNTN